MTDQHDAIVIGAGHNGLACAALLARGGRKVLVLEAAERVGGACITREFAPGFKVSAGAHLSCGLNPRLVRELDLQHHGLQFAASNLDTISLAADGAHLRLHGDEVLTGEVSTADRSALRTLHARLGKFARLLAGLYDQRPPRLAPEDRGELFAAAKMGLALRRLGRDDMREFLRIAAINIYDVLEEQFDSEALKGALAMDAVLGAHLGPRSNNSVLNLLHRWAGSAASQPGTCALPRGGMGAVSDALAAAAQANGATIRTGAEVASIELDGTRVAGVKLANGETLSASLIVSGADPRTTFLDLVGAHRLEAGFAKRIDNIRMRGNAAKLHLALDGLPAIPGLDEDSLAQRLLYAPTAAHIERAFDCVKYRECSAAPVMEITLPSLVDPGLAPAGKHVLSAIVQYVPYAPDGGWEAQREPFTETVLAQLESLAPGLRDRVSDIEFLTPVDLEKEFRMSGGHWHHGELAFDQFLMMRPVPGAAQYAAPIDGLWLCGAGTHPGGGVMGTAGRNAARAILAE